MTQNYTPPATGKNVVPYQQVAQKTRKELMDAKFSLIQEPSYGYTVTSQDELLKDKAVMRLLDMLKYMRPHDSEVEQKFIDHYIKPLGSTKDGFGNRWIKIYYPDGGEPDIIFSCHTDTVHTEAGFQSLTVGDGRVYTEEGSCLGADDTTGVWLALEMVRAKVPGLYLFHRSEEIGGQGSQYLKTHFVETLKKYKAAIALDRKGYGDIITHQGGDRCCSDTFAKSLGDILGGTFTASTGGTFTDTKNYTDLIGECTNISVGYFDQHGKSEWQDLSFAYALRLALIAADWSKLVFERKPGEVERLSYGRQYGSYNWSDEDMYGWMTSDAPYGKSDRKVLSVAEQKERHRISTLTSRYGWAKRDQYAKRAERLIEFTGNWPETVAMFLADKGFSEDDIVDWTREFGEAYGDDKWDT